MNFLPIAASDMDVIIGIIALIGWIAAQVMGKMKGGDKTAPPPGDTAAPTDPQDELRKFFEEMEKVLPKDYEWQEDGAIALTYFELAAQACGVGACWGGFLTMAVRNFPELREFLGIKEDERVCGAQMFGWPAAKPVRLFPHRKLDVTRV